jgi:hypothetical protein
MEKIISFSLWGTRDLYLHGALVNAKQTAEYFPGWSVRIYHDDTVPQTTLDALATWKHITLVKVTDGSYGMFWRFHPLFEDAIVIIRDLDSRITWRDVRCVDEWLATDKKLHVIRDHDEHYKVPIMGGLFGLRGPLPEFHKAISNLYEGTHQYNMDQIFLGRHVWPSYEHDCLQHGYREHVWMAESRTADDHMGRGYTVDEKPRMDHGG